MADKQPVKRQMMGQMPKPIVKVVVSLYSTKIDASTVGVDIVEGEITVGGLLSILEAGKMHILSQPIVSKDLEKVQSNTEPEADKQEVNKQQ
jgi:hypothetical protein